MTRFKMHKEFGESTTVFVKEMPDGQFAWSNLAEEFSFDDGSFDTEYDCIENAKQNMALYGWSFDCSRV